MAGGDRETQLRAALFHAVAIRHEGKAKASTAKAATTKRARKPVAVPPSREGAPPAAPEPAAVSRPRAVVPSGGIVELRPIPGQSRAPTRAKGPRQRGLVPVMAQDEGHAPGSPASPWDGGDASAALAAAVDLPTSAPGNAEELAAGR